MIIRFAISFLLSFLVAGNCAAQFNSGRASISVSINNEIYPYQEFATYVLPQEHLGICLMTDDLLEFEVTATSGALDHIEDCRWIWTAPATEGLTEIHIVRGPRDVMKINVFVMTPGNRLISGKIDNVEIGTYPRPLENSPLYQRPDGFIRVTRDNIDTPVSPHFVLGQLVTPLDDSFPKYMVLRERLLLKLEVLMERLYARGIEAGSLSVVAGYMTPAYNASIGGPVQNRHIYGGAATVIVDRDADGRMDDLNGDGTLDHFDGQFLFDIIDELYSEPGKEYLRGGLFLYNNVDNRGPMVMLDARGFRKRWPNGSELMRIPENLRPKHRRQF